VGFLRACPEDARTARDCRGTRDLARLPGACTILARMSQPPERKISETMIDFGEPLVSELESGMPGEVIRSVFEMVITVWNAHVTAMPRWGRPQFLADLDRLPDDPQLPSEAVAALRELSSRRSLPRFVDDDRAVGEWSLVGGAQCWRLRCDAREPAVEPGPASRPHTQTTALEIDHKLVSPTQLE
jgi:hypothetical protein